MILAKKFLICFTFERMTQNPIKGVSFNITVMNSKEPYVRRVEVHIHRRESITERKGAVSVVKICIFLFDHHVHDVKGQSFTRYIMVVISVIWYTTR